MRTAEEDPADGFFAVPRCGHNWISRWCTIVDRTKDMILFIGVQRPIRAPSNKAIYEHFEGREKCGRSATTPFEAGAQGLYQTQAGRRIPIRQFANLFLKQRLAKLTLQSMEIS